MTTMLLLLLVAVFACWLAPRLPAAIEQLKRELNR